MSSPLDLDAYFARIGYAGPRTPALQTLRDVVFRHATTIPFENLDVLLSRGISLDLAAVQKKLVADRRGGYCFEQNGLLLEVLRALGFQVVPVSARVRLKVARDFTPPRTHVFLKVIVDGVPWLADVGVGGLSPASPLRLDVESEQPTPHEPRRVIREGAVLHHQARLSADAWSDVCEFTLEEMPPIDRELANYWTSTNAASKFKLNLFAARALPDGTRVSILNNEFTHRRGAGHIESRVLATHRDLLDVLAERFGLRFPADTRFACANATFA